MACWLNRWEQALARQLTMPTGSPWRWLPSLGAHLGDGAAWAVAGVGLLIWGTPFLRGLMLVTSLAVIGAAIPSTVIKYLVRRPRPQELTQFYAIRTDRYSFPSGHAARMAAIATVVGRFVPALAPIGYLLALAVALCRIVVGVHYLSDVLAGLLIGSLSGWAVLLCI